MSWPPRGRAKHGSNTWYAASASKRCVGLAVGADEHLPAAACRFSNKPEQHRAEEREGEDVPVEERDPDLAVVQPGEVAARVHEAHDAHALRRLPWTSTSTSEVHLADMSGRYASGTNISCRLRAQGARGYVSAP